MTYNQKRHIELLKCFQYQESKDEYLELSEYEGAIQSYVYWKSRQFSHVKSTKLIKIFHCQILQ